MSLSQSAFNDVTKELYPSGLDKELVMKRCPLLSMMDQRMDFYHRWLHIPIRYKLPQGASNTAADAYTNESASGYDAFQVTRVNTFGFWKIAGEVVDASAAGNDAVFVDSVKAEMDGMLETMSQKLGANVYRSTSGSVATVGSGTSSPITLANVEDIYYFEVGKVITANDSDDATTPRSGSGTITNINEDTGVITYTGTITSLTVGDYLFVDGDEATAGAGLSAWVPSSAPGATSFFGVDRSVHTSRLGGVRFDASGYTMEEVPIRARARAARGPSGFRPDYWFINPTDMADFEVAKEGQKFITSAQNYSFGIEGMQAYGCKFIEDPNCQVGTMWGIDMSAWKWATMGDAPRLFNADGLDFIRSGSGTDFYEGQMVARHNWYSDAPGRIIRVTLPS
jgi:hypothetical protein